MIGDERLLDFELRDWAGPQRRDAEDLLAEYGDLYRSHLVIALSLSDTSRNIRCRRFDPNNQGDLIVGELEILAEITDHLRRGDYLPSGKLFCEVDQQSW